MSTYLDTLNEKVPGAFTAGEFRDNKRVLVPADKAADTLYQLLACLKEECGFDFLSDVAGIDYLGYPNATDRYGVVYALVNTATGERLFVKAFANDPDPEVARSVASVIAASQEKLQVFRVKLQQAAERERHGVGGIRYQSSAPLAPAHGLPGRLFEQPDFDLVPPAK